MGRRLSAKKPAPTVTKYTRTETSGYLPSESVVGLYGEVITRPISTSKLNTAQFTAYLEKVQVLASSELGHRAAGT